MFYRFLPIVTVLLTLIATTWITLLPLNGVTQADISNRYPTLITPAPFTFSIWSVIYILWIISAGMIALKLIEVWKKQKVVFSLSVALTAVWLIPWNYDRIYVSLLVILMIFASFSFLFLKTRKKETPKIFQYTVDFSYGWIIVATLANTFVYMKSLNIVQDTHNQVIIAILGLFVWAMIQVALLNGFKAFLPLFVYVWALWGIYNNQDIVWIKLTALFISIILLLNYIYFRKKVYQRCLTESYEPYEKDTKKKKTVSKPKKRK